MTRATGLPAENYYEEGEGEDMGLDFTHVGPYEIIAPIGKGGFGKVYKAIDRARDQTVAIKVLYRRYDLDRRRRRRNNLLDEFHTVARLRHENVILPDRIIEQEDAQGHVRRCLVMEYIDGHDLRRHIRERDLSMAQALDLTLKLCRGLDYLHQHGIVHKDVKPENFLLSRDRVRVKIVDFGMSQSAAGWWTRWVTGPKGGGTKAYMAPEQLAGDHVDARSDIFSLGITLYELFSGHHPCPGPGRAEIARQIRSRRFRFEPPSKFNRDIPVALDRIILKALRRNPNHRYQSVTEMLLDLIRLCNPRI